MEEVKRGFVSYTVVGVDVGLRRYARLMMDRNVGTQMHCYTYQGMVRLAREK